MVITHPAPDKVQLKTKTETIQVNDQVHIGHYQVPGAGEYDVASIHCEAQNLSSGTVYFIRCEDLTVTFLSQINPEVMKIDDASKTDILIVEVRSDNTADQLKPILKSLEPGYLFLVGAGATEQFSKELGLQSHDSSTLKVTRGSLPMEGTLLVPAT